MSYRQSPFKAVIISGDHTENNNEDEQRVRKAGGFFVNGKVNGLIPFTRSIGDFYLKNNAFLDKNEQIINSKASLFSLRKKDLKHLILGSSGIWEKANLVLKKITE